MSTAEFIGINDNLSNNDDNTTAVNSEIGNGLLKDSSNVKGWSDRPFILTDVVPHWPAYQGQQGHQGQEKASPSSASPLPWTVDNLLKHHGNVIFRAEALDWPLSTYVEYMRDNQDESPLYLFDCRFAEKMGMGMVANENENKNRDEVNADTSTDVADSKEMKRETSGDEHFNYGQPFVISNNTEIKRTDEHVCDDDDDKKERGKAENNNATQTPTVPPFWPPACFADNLFDVWDADERPDWRWMIIGPERSGSTFHVDPNGTRYFFPERKKTHL